MPLPLGHAAVGIATGELAGKKKPAIAWKYYIFVAFLANLPDMDVVIGLLFNGNGNLFHRGMTHSLLFALVMGFLAAQGWKLWPKLPKISFYIGFLVIFSHVAADMLFTGSPVSLFWPLEIYRPSEYKGWLDILNVVFFEASRDAAIIAGSAIVFFLTRWARQTLALLTSPAVQTSNEGS